MPGAHSQSGITKSPYEPGVYFVRGQTWQVTRFVHRYSKSDTQVQKRVCNTLNVQIGERYELLKQLGTGSFSEVCSATDRSTGEKVKTPSLSNQQLLAVCLHSMTTQACSLSYCTGSWYSPSQLQRAVEPSECLHSTDQTCMCVPGCCQAYTRCAKQS